jgi:hypothetical protein
MHVDQMARRDVTAAPLRVSDFAGAFAPARNLRRLLFVALHEAAGTVSAVRSSWRSFMKRILGLTGAVALTLVAASCASYNSYNSQIAFTTSESIVANCQKIGDIEAKSTAENAMTALADQAREKGANYVLLPSDGARTGTAYKCEVPKVASK